MKKKILVSMLCFVITFLLLQTGSVTAAKIYRSGSYRYTVTNKKATITDYKGKSSSVTIPSKLGGYPVTCIGEYAFWGKKFIKKVVIPSSVKEINHMAFSECSNLKSVSLPAKLTTIGNYTFSLCTDLKEIKIPNSVTTIGEGAFSSCSKLTTVTLPKNLSELSTYLFNDTAIRKITLPDHLTKIGEYAFYQTPLEEIEIPESVEVIQCDTFGKCTKLESIRLPEGLTEVAFCLFEDCTSLNEVQLSSKTKSIDSMAFSGCAALKEMIIPEGVEKISESCFKNCSSLRVIDLPESLQYIERDAFNGCSSLAEIHNLSKELYTIKDGVIYNQTDKLIKYLPANERTEFQVPEGVTAIGDFAFADALELTYVEIPDSVEEIGIGLFYQSGLEKFDLPKKITKIPTLMFYGCAMKEMVLPKQITKIGSEAFVQCSKMETFTMSGKMKDLDLIDSYEIEGYNPFRGCLSLRKFVITGKQDKYKVIDDVLFYENDDHTLRLIAYPAQKKGTSYTVPSNTVSLGTHAFDSCAYLQKLYLSNKMTALYNHFIDCKNLKIYVPKGVTHFMSEEHISDWPIFTRCSNCYLYVKKGSKAYTYCAKNKIPYKVWK